MILDHVFVLPRGFAAARGTGALAAPTLEAAGVFTRRLAGFGLAAGSSRSHPGQGTANRRCFLDDLMIECLLVDDETALDDPRGAPLRLAQRFRDRAASGVGFGFRPGPGAARSLPEPGFDAVAYRPAYLPDSLHIDVARAPDARAPLLFHLPFARRASGAVPDDGEPRAHPNGARRVGGLRYEGVADASDEARRVLTDAGVRCTSGAGAECLHVRLDGASDGAELDLRPLFPLRLHA